MRRCFSPIVTLILRHVVIHERRYQARVISLIHITSSTCNNPRCASNGWTASTQRQLHGIEHLEDWTLFIVKIRRAHRFTLSHANNHFQVFSGDAISLGIRVGRDEWHFIRAMRVKLREYSRVPLYPCRRDEQVYARVWRTAGTCVFYVDTHVRHFVVTGASKNTYVCVRVCVCVVYVRARASTLYRARTLEHGSQQTSRNTRLGRSGDTEWKPRAGLRASPLPRAPRLVPPPLLPRLSYPPPQSLHLRERGGSPYVRPALKFASSRGESSLSSTPASRTFSLAGLVPFLSLSPVAPPSLSLTLSHVYVCIVVHVCASRTSRGLFALSCLSMRHYTTTYTCAPRAGMLGPELRTRTAEAYIRFSYNRFHHERRVACVFSPLLSRDPGENAWLTERAPTRPSWYEFRGARGAYRSADCIIAVSPRVIWISLMLRGKDDCSSTADRWMRWILPSILIRIRMISMPLDVSYL